MRTLYIYGGGGAVCRSLHINSTAAALNVLCRKSLRATQMHGIEHPCVISASTTCMRIELFAESADAGMQTSSKCRQKEPAETAE